MVKRLLEATALALGVLAAASARAEEPAPPAGAAAQVAPGTATPEAPASAPEAPASAPDAALAAPAHGELHHAPVSFAQTEQDIRIRATIDHPELVRRAILLYRRPGAAPVEVEFERAADGPYAAVIPSAEVRAPVIEYAIELEDLSGVRQRAFATREAMHSVEVADERMDEQERAELARVGGQRTVISANVDYVSFGDSLGSLRDQAGQVSNVSVADSYWRAEAGFTYRLLRTVSEFGIRGGVVRGSSPVKGVHLDRREFDVGLNYGSPWARFRLSELFHLDAQLLTSLTEVGFSGGFGGALHIGDVHGSQLTLGGEYVSVFGTRFYSRVDAATGSRLMLSAVVEATDMPHASRYGIRLIGEVGAHLWGGFRAAIRGGYQARDSASGGPAAGVTVAYGF